MTQALANLESARGLLNDYIKDEKIANFGQIPTHIKLELLQKTPKQFIKTKPLDGEDIKYIDHKFSKKCLNFVFNFRVSNEVSNERYHEYDEKYKYQKADKTAPNGYRWIEGERHVIEAECTVKFTFIWDDGTSIIRTVYSSHKNFSNKANTRGDTMQSAISKAWTKVAATFGIGADLEDDFNAALVKKKPAVVNEVLDAEESEPEITTPVKKVFQPEF